MQPRPRRDRRRRIPARCGRARVRRCRHGLLWAACRRGRPLRARSRSRSRPRRDCLPHRHGGLGRRRAPDRVQRDVARGPGNRDALRQGRRPADLGAVRAGRGRGLRPAARHQRRDRSGPRRALRRDAAWKFRAVGQGFAGGLAPLARTYGVDVDEAAPPPVAPTPQPTQPRRPRPLPRRRSRSVSPRSA